MIFTLSIILCFKICRNKRNYYALIHTRESQQMIMEELGKYLLQFTPAV